LPRLLESGGRLPYAAPAMNLPIKVGDIIRIAEADYCYGIGDLLLRVTALPPAKTPDGGDWVYITGDELAWNGANKGQRQVLVRVSALFRERRP